MMPVPESPCIDDGIERTGDQVDFKHWSSAIQQRMERALSRAVPGPALVPSGLHEAMRYASLEGGKRVRPLLVFAAAGLCSGVHQAAEQAACAVELIHAYSLVHDDMPCMDDDILRRGKPTVHKAYDEPTALLVGDALQSLAFELLAAPGLLPSAQRQLQMVACLASAAGSQGMAGGQAIDLDAVGKTLDLSQLETMHRLKTGALIRASVRLGALCGAADAADLERLDHYASRVGLAFQVIDDVLDAQASTQTLGKTAGKDAQANKPTYVSLLGLDKARQLAADLRSGALASIAPFGHGAHRLAELANFVIQRAF